MLSTARSVADWMAPIWAPISSVAFGLAGQRLHLARHHGEALARLARPRRLDRRVQRQQVGLPGDVADQPQHVADALRRVGEAGDLAIRRRHVVRGAAGGLRRPRHLAGDLVHRSRQLLGRRRHGLHIRRRLFRADGGGARPLRRRLGRRRQPGDAGFQRRRGLRQLLHHRAELPLHPVREVELGLPPLLLGRQARGLRLPLQRAGAQRGLPQPLQRAGHGPDLVAAVLVRHRRIQVALRDAAHQRRRRLHRPGHAAGQNPGEQRRQQRRRRAAGQDGGARPGMRGIRGLRRIRAALHVVVGQRLQALAQPAEVAAHLPGVERGRLRVAGAGRGEQPLLIAEIGEPGGTRGIGQAPFLRRGDQRRVVAPITFHVGAGAGQVLLLPPLRVRAGRHHMHGLELAVARRMLGDPADDAGAGQPVVAQVGGGVVHHVQPVQRPEAEAEGQDQHEAEAEAELAADGQGQQGTHSAHLPAIQASRGGFISM
nr:hypothetical protein [Paracraurococcus ruber]